VAKWYTPLDHGIDGIGIEPDVTVIFKNEDYDKKYDRQLEEAKKVIKQYVEKGYDKTLEDIKREKEKASSEAQKINPEK
jgi:C-terminal processing protease CtpA/Prc